MTSREWSRGVHGHPCRGVLVPRPLHSTEPMGEQRPPVAWRPAGIAHPRRGSAFSCWPPGRSRRCHVGRSGWCVPVRLWGGRLHLPEAAAPCSGARPLSPGTLCRGWPRRSATTPALSCTPSTWLATSWRTEVPGGWAGTSLHPRKRVLGCGCRPQPPPARGWSSGRGSHPRRHRRSGSLLAPGVTAFSRHVERSPRALQSLSVARTTLTAKGTARAPLGAGTAVPRAGLAPKGWPRGCRDTPERALPGMRCPAAPHVLLHGSARCRGPTAAASRPLLEQGWAHCARPSRLTKPPRPPSGTWTSRETLAPWLGTTSA